MFQQRHETGQVVARLFGKISATEKRRLIRRQKQGERPAAVALGQHGMGGLVNVVEVRALFAIHLDVDEMLIHHRRDLGILERFMRHDMAPVAGGITDGKQDGLILFARAL